MAKMLMKGNEAIAEAAIRAGCRFFFGYPITPQNEIPEYMARRMPQVEGTFVQAESEVAAINMVYGAAGAGARVMTSSSSPGVSLKMEGISYIAGARLPCVVVNIVRGGPGLGGIQASQSDYLQATKGGGHGDYHMVVLAPSNLQEAVELTQEAFDIADQYRVPVMLLGDGMLGQMMEPLDMEGYQPRSQQSKTWATTGMDGKRKPNIINSLFLDPQKLEDHNHGLQQTYQVIGQNEIKVACDGVDDADIIVTAYGTTARIVEAARALAQADGVKIGVIRPITLWPFPVAAFKQAAQSNAKAILSVELSEGQMVEDVKLAVGERKPVYFYGRSGGMMPTPKQIYDEIQQVLEGRRSEWR